MSTAHNRLMYFLGGLAFLGVVPASLALASTSVAWAPFAVVAAPVSALWGLAFVRAVLPTAPVAAAAGQRLKEQVDRLAREAGIQPPSVHVSRRVSGAGVSWCNGQPRLTFPMRRIERLDDEELSAYVAHELAHQTQPEYRSVLSFNRASDLVGGGMLGLTFLMLYRLVNGGVPMGFLCAYLALPLALTAAVMLRSLFVRHALERIEVGADDQAVEWGVPPTSLAIVLERLETAEMRVPLAPDQWLLRRLLFLLTPSMSRVRVQRLRARAPLETAAR